MKVAKVPFSVALLENLLPLGSKILSVRENEYRQTIDVLIQHESFKDVPNGELPPTRSLVAYRSHDPLIPTKVEYAA